MQAGVKNGGKLLFLVANCPKGVQTLLNELLLRGPADEPSCPTCINLVQILLTALLSEEEYEACKGDVAAARGVLALLLNLLQWDRTPQCSGECRSLQILPFTCAALLL